jgi:hypothetical protein
LIKNVLVVVVLNGIQIIALIFGEGSIVMIKWYGVGNLRITSKE